MKIVTVAALLAFASAPLFAERDMMGQGGMGRGMMKRMKEKLELTDAQAEKMKALNEADGEANKALRDKVAADVANLKVLVNKKAADAELSALISTLKADTKAMQEAQQKHRDAMQQFLTPMQQAKAALMMVDWMGGGMKGMRGHGDDEDEAAGKGGDGDDHEHEHEGKGKKKN